jgi:23S rRNA pseudouridine1911/1915/1917 synthase
MNIPIIFEDNDILVIDKPANLLVHPAGNSKTQAPNHKENTLIDFFPKTKLVHRLDKDTSGLIILAKNEKTFDWLKSQFKNRKIKKKYLALVHGKIKDKKGIITKSISKSRKRGGSQTTTPIGKAREAITRYNVLKEYPNHTLLEVLPETGRTHQIRVHLASIGHPIAGDEKYKFKRQKQIPKLNRQFLHASHLKFQILDGNIKEFESKLPAELNEVLENL